MIHGRCICSSIILFICGYYFHLSFLVSAAVLSFPHTNYRPNLASPKTTVPTVYMYNVLAHIPVQSIHILVQSILFINYIVPCQRMETLRMGLSCVVLVKMGKILDTYVHKKTNNKK